MERCCAARWGPTGEDEVLSDTELEDIAETTLKEARLAHSRPPDMVKLARQVVGPVIQLPARGLPRAAFLARYGGRQHVCIRGEFAPSALAWCLAHEVSEAILERRLYRAPDVEQVANRLAACFLAPRGFAEGVIERGRSRGLRWTQLALDFGTSESCAVLRYGEVTGHGVALVSPKDTRYRGNWFVLPEERDIRSPGPVAGLKKALLRDNPSRMVVVSA